MKVERKDGECRKCGGQLTIVEVDDATMSVECEECGEFYGRFAAIFGDAGFCFELRGKEMNFAGLK